jgi:N-dimethylarginine dimethylaminohydrolase
MVKLPYWFLDKLADLGIRTVEVHPDEWGAVNCLAVRPGKVIMPGPSPRTAERLNRLGVEVIEIDYSEVEKGGGGVHCSTLPLIRG